MMYNTHELGVLCIFRHFGMMAHACSRAGLAGSRVIVALWSESSMEQTIYRRWVEGRTARAQTIAAAGGIEQALASGGLPRYADVTLSEAIVLGLLRQDVRRFIGIFGHGTTEIGEVLRVYEKAGVVRTFAVRHEAEASHAAAALRWVTGEKAAVFTSIGPGALHAFAASLAPASDGLGVWYLFGDETTHNEGPNMQQIPKPEQELFLRLCQTMGQGLLSAHAGGRWIRIAVGIERGGPSAPGRAVLSRAADEPTVQSAGRFQLR